MLENVFLGVEDTVAGVVEQRRLMQRYDRLVADSGIELPAEARAYCRILTSRR